ncbi:MAG: SPOR domain-containing protein [Firmicutes bacterium]|nr:SPOR domain-containing protein [Bacillota bacterium]
MSSGTRRKKSGRGGSFLPLLLVLVLFAGGLGYGVTIYLIYPQVLEIEEPVSLKVSFLDKLAESNPSGAVVGEQPLSQPPADSSPYTGEPYTNTALAGEGGSTESNPSGAVVGEQPLSQPLADSSPYTGEPYTDSSSYTGEAQLVYAIQFGSYSSYAGAQEAADAEKAKGREVRIVEKEGSYKIVSSPYSDRTEAERELAVISPEGEDGLFITTMEVFVQ